MGFSHLYLPFKNKLASHRDTGTFTTTRGKASAACYTFHVIIRGVGAHGANPHQSKDPVAAAGAVISGIHQIVSRTITPTDAAVISIGMKVSALS